MDSKEYEIVVIGAGIHSLTLICALLEDATMAPDLVDANRGLLRSKLSERQLREKLIKRKNKAKSSIWNSKEIAVIDKFGDWLSNWKRQFQVLGIESLRSNASLHPDPIDPEMLFEFARMQGLTTEQAFVEITETKRQKDFLGPFQRPTTKLFNEFCDYLIDSYKIKDCLIQDEVVDIRALTELEKETKFQLRLKSGKSVTSKVVVSAIGHTNLRNLPLWVDMDQCPPKSILHAWDIVHENFGEACFHEKSIMVVGGGLTALQLVNLAISCGSEMVFLVSRRELNQRQFDSDLSWSGRLRLKKLSEFWQEPNYSHRIDQIKKARNGGTITSYAFAELERHQSTSKCVVFEATEIWDAEWDSQTEAFQVELSNSDQCSVHQIWLATGSSIDIHQEQAFQSLCEDYDLKSISGYPILDQKLRWHPEWNLFFIGAYASLALGPDGVNLAGARRAAFRIKETFKTVFQTS